MKEFIKKYERQSKESINRAYRDIDMLYFELDFLNDLLQRYSNKKSGRTLTIRERQQEMDSIRERIPRIYQDINYYKECINAERKEMKRIYNTYGPGSDFEFKYEKPVEYNYNDIRLEYHEDVENDDTSSYHQYDEEDEEIKEYKYNSATDTWE